MFPYVGNVVVDESFRRKGIAFSLMNQALQSTKDWGVTYAFCAVHTENEAASDLYLNKLGFKIFRLEENGGSFFSIDKRSRYILVKQFHDTNIDGDMDTMLPNFLGDEIIDEDDVDEDVDIDIEDTEIEADTDYYSD